MLQTESINAKLVAGFMAINLAILVGARALSYYGAPSNPSELLFSIISAINFIIVWLLYAWFIKLEGLQREAYLSKQHLKSVDEALHIMRSERHDFINHLQAVYGLLCGGNNKEAVNYIKNMGVECRFNNQLLNIRNPYLRALLLNKNHELSPKAIDLNIKVKSKLEHLDLAPPSITTIFGNLIDNAHDAVAAIDDNRPRRISFEAYEFEDKYCFLISDTGPPIDSDIIERLYDRGFSTKGKNRGYGMALIKDELSKYGGEIKYDPETKSFTVVIPFSA